MNKTKSLYAIYKFDFHKSSQRSTLTPDGVDGAKYVKQAQRCFASLFDKNSIDKLAKKNKKGEIITLLPNDVLAKADDIFLWRVNNSQFKDWWKRSGKDPKGFDTYEKDEIESNPYCYVLIDNRPGVGLMAIEKSSAWGSNPDQLRDVILENFNRMMGELFDLEMRIEARMNPKDIWEFMHERIYEHNDYVRKVSFSFQNPKKINKSKSTSVNSAHLKAILRTAVISDALEGIYVMLFDKNSQELTKENQDMAEMVRLCSENGYNLSITFNEFKTYRINDYVRAYYPLTFKVIHDFNIGSRTREDMTELEEWFNLINEQTKDYLNESEVPKRRNKARK